MFIIDWLKKVKRYIVQEIKLRYDINKYFKYYTDSAVGDNKKILYERDIMVLCHTVEKGLSHNQLKPLFGIDSVKKISEYLCAYLKLDNVDEYIIALAVETLNEYNEVNKTLGVEDDKLIFVPSVEKKVKLGIGASMVSADEYYRNADGTFKDVLMSRHSVRLYDAKSKKISVDKLKKCILDAMNCPSACNRQAVRVKIVTEEDAISKICDIQGGARGFGTNSGALLIITSDVRYYMVSERRLPMLDCGIFIMNLCYALYAEKLGSCILNGSMLKNQEEELNKIVEIPPYEMVAAVISVSDIPEGTVFKIAKSCKKDVESIITVND